MLCVSVWCSPIMEALFWWDMRSGQQTLMSIGASLGYLP